MLKHALIAGLGFAAVSLSPSAVAQPNVVVLISDDAGYADWEFMDEYLQSENPGQPGSPVPTPNLNSLRNRGVLFTQAYTASVCSPSRAAIVTGSYQQRMGYEYNINNLTEATAVDGLSPNTVTLFHRMKSAGYTTGAIGKWHLGARDNTAGLGNRPENMGVDEFLGIWQGSRNYTVGGVTGVGTLRETIASPFSDTVLESTAPWNTTYNYVTTAFGKGAIDFIGRHYHDPNPFLLYVAFTAPHGPIGPSPDINDLRIAALTGTRKDYASMVLTMDKEIGTILAKIDDPVGDGSISLTTNTLVVFINDNGGASGNGTVNTPLRNWKGSSYEGGTRVPMIIAGPGVPSNPASPISYGKPVHSIDILPTCLAAAGVTPPGGLDGVNLIPYLDGTNPGDPHALVTIRAGTKVGLRKGNWKLTKNASGVPFELYNLAGDLPESTDLSGSYPNLVAELLRDWTAFEAGCDKPRHAGLNDPPDSINLNDHFRLNPVNSPTPTPTGPNVVRNPGFEIGTQADSDLKYTFAELSDWSNNGAETSDVGAINDDSRSGTYRGVFVVTTRIPYQLTDHVIAGGETMLLDFWHKGKSGWDAGDTIDVELFYLDGGGAVQVISSATFSPDPGGWQESVHLFPAITHPAAVGRTLGIRFLSNGAGGEFVSIDDVFLGTGTSSGGGAAMIAWSDVGAWIDTDTGLSDTLLTSDAFAGAVLEFPTTDTFSYNASNDMARMTDLEFMLNRMQLSGSFSGGSSQSATLTGNELLFTDDLSGDPPTIDISADGSGFSFHIENDLILYDDLEIAGNGDTPVEIAGSIRDYFDPRGLNKSGSSTVLLSGSHTYSGATHVLEGTLLINSGASLASSAVLVDTSGTLGGEGTIHGAVTVGAGGTLSPGTSIGTLTISNNLALGGGVLIELDKGASPSNDVVNVTGALIYGGSLTVANIGAAALVVGDTFAIFPAGGSGTVTVAGEAGPGLALEFDEATGVLSVVSAGRPGLSWSDQGGGVIEFTFNDVASKLVYQTNALSVGLSTNWVDYPGGDTSPVSVTNDPAIATTFFGLQAK